MLRVLIWLVFVSYLVLCIFCHRAFPYFTATVCVMITWQCGGSFPPHFTQVHNLRNRLTSLVYSRCKQNTRCVQIQLCWKHHPTTLLAKVCTYRITFIKLVSRKPNPTYNAAVLFHSETLQRPLDKRDFHIEQWRALAPLAHVLLTWWHWRPQRMRIGMLGRAPYSTLLVAVSEFFPVLTINEWQSAAM